MRVLVADDERLLTETIADGLRDLAFAVDTAFDGTTAWDLLTVNRYDIAVLDRDMPGCSGDEVCRKMSAAHLNTRVILLTAAASIRDRVEGLGLGADDYLTKPFDFAELVARVHALGRRFPHSVQPILESGGVCMDVPRHSATRDGRVLHLTPKEFGVLEVLLRTPGQLVTPEELLEQAWDVNTDPFTNTMRVVVMNLRKKLGSPPIIHTVRRAGYRIGE